MLSQKELTILISTWKPKCDLTNGMYNNIDKNEKHMVFSFKPTLEEFHVITKSKEKLKWIDDNNYNIDCTWDKKTGSLIPRIKRVFNPDAREHFNKDLCKILNVKSLIEIAKTFTDEQTQAMESIFSIYNKQFKVAFASTQKLTCLNNLTSTPVTPKLDGQILRMMKHSNDNGNPMTYEQCHAVIG